MALGTFENNEGSSPWESVGSEDDWHSTFVEGADFNGLDPVIAGQFQDCDAVDGRHHINNRLVLLEGDEGVRVTVFGKAKGPVMELGNFVREELLATVVTVSEIAAE